MVHCFPVQSWTMKIVSPRDILDFRCRLVTAIVDECSTEGNRYIVHCFLVQPLTIKIVYPRDILNFRCRLVAAIVDECSTEGNTYIVQCTLFPSATMDNENFPPMGDISVL